MRNLMRGVVIASASMMLGSTGCTIKASLDQTTDTTSNITGSTSGAAWWSEDGQIKPDFKAAAFISFNQANLQQDLAAGRGEYLESMGRLLGVPEDRQSAFFSAAQAGYAETVGKDSTALLALLRDTSKPFVQ